MWAVDGGNKRLCLGLLYHSKSELIPATVTSVGIEVRPSKKGDFFFFCLNIFIYTRYRTAGTHRVTDSTVIIVHFSPEMMATISDLGNI